VLVEPFALSISFDYLFEQRCTDTHPQRELSTKQGETVRVAQGVNRVSLYDSMVYNSFYESQIYDFSLTYWCKDIYFFRIEIDFVVFA